MTTETGNAVLTIFDQLLDRIKSTRPIRTDGKELTTGFVYSQLVLGQMVDPQDYARPWSPMGGSTLQEAMNTPTPAPSPTADGTTPGNNPPAPPDPKFRRAIEAAFKTSQLVDNMIMVTNDGAYVEYPTQRHISFAYENIINAMQPTPVPPIAPEVQKQIDDSQKVLYEFDEEGNIIGKSRLFRNYTKNAQAYAKAKKDYNDAQTAALADPLKADSWPMDSVYYQQIVDDAWDTFKTMGAEKVERALDIIESIGVSMQDRMIAKARKIYDAWNLGIAGVPIPIPYSYVEPTRWYDIEDDDEGWQYLKITSKEYAHHTTSQESSNFQRNWEKHSTADGGGGGVGFAFVFAGAEGGHKFSTSSKDTSSASGSDYQFHNSAKNLTIELEYGLCTIHRPWLLGDVFYMRNWYLVNNPKNAVSDGTITNQVQNEQPLLPMIPSQFLVIRNVKIHTTEWGSDSETFQTMQSDYHRKQESESDYVSAGGGLSLGFITIGGHGSHSSSDTTGNSDGSSNSSGFSDYGWRFYENTLEVRGAQIVAWLSEVVPACAPLSDPNLPTNQK